MTQFQVIAQEIADHRRALRKLVSTLHATLPECTPPQVEAISELYTAGPMASGELCQRMGLANSTATDLIDRMERNGLLERVRDTPDRRVIRLRLTDKARRLVEGKHAVPA